MRGVKFNDKHSFETWELMLKEYPVVSPPKVQSTLITVAGKDGAIDLSKALDGFVHYDSRTITLKFVYMGDRQKWFDVYSDLQNYLHGESMKIVLDDDPDFYYMGMCEVGNPNYGKKTVQFTVTCTVDPYKYEHVTSLENWLWDPFSFKNGVVRQHTNIKVQDTKTIYVGGTKMPVRPEFIVEYIDEEKGLTVTFEKKEYSLHVGTNLIPNILIGSGKHILKFTGVGTLSISYQGGRL